jgi:hypothetical protein
LAQKFWDEAKQFDMIWDIVLGKVERYYLIQNLIDQSKTFDLVRLLSELKYNTPLTISYKTKTDNFCQVSSKHCCKCKKRPVVLFLHIYKTKTDNICQDFIKKTVLNVRKGPVVLFLQGAWA